MNEYAIVTSAICPLRSEPKHDCERADEALCGMVVEILEKTTEDYWKVRTHYRYEGYAPVSCLRAEEKAVEEWKNAPKKVVLHKNTCDIQAGPKVQSWELLSVTRGAVLAVIGEPEEGWQRVRLPDGREGCIFAGVLDTYYEDPVDLPEAELRRRLVETAKLYVGTHYRWGGKSPLGIDCSGLVSTSYLLNGIIIHRDAGIKEGFPIREIPREELKMGDLIFFPGHVAMYIENGDYIHSTGKAGSDGVVFNSLDPDSPIYREDLDKKVTAAGTYF